MFGRIFSAFRPAQTTPGLLLCDGEERTPESRLLEYERRVSVLKLRTRHIRPEGNELHEYDEDLEAELAWWSRTGFLLNRSFQRTVAGRALQARIALSPGAPKLEATVYEIHINNRVRNKASFHAHLLRSIK